MHRATHDDWPSSNLNGGMHHNDGPAAGCHRFCHKQHLQGLNNDEEASQGPWAAAWSGARR